MTTPYKGATVAQFYVAEIVAGQTPVNPSWKPLRTVSGIPSITRDSLISNELNASREVSSVRTGNEQVAGEYAIELSQSSQDDLLSAAMTSDWVAGSTVASQAITVDATAKTFSGAGFTAEAGDLIYFPSLTGNNAKPFMVTAATPTLITGAAIQHALADETADSTLVIADTLSTGDLCKSISILTWMKGRCGTADAWLLTKGVEVSGFTIELAVNAMVTGSFPMIGRSQEILAGLPSGSTFVTNFSADPFASVDVSAFDGAAPLKLVDSFTITNDNETSSQFELGNRGVAFIERGRANNTFSLAGKLYDLTMVEKFINETDVTLHAILSGVSGAMSFTLNDSKITAATPELGGPESVTLSVEGQATGSSMKSSIVIQRLVY